MSEQNFGYYPPSEEKFKALEEKLKQENKEIPKKTLGSKILNVIGGTIAVVGLGALGYLSVGALLSLRSFDHYQQNNSYSVMKRTDDILYKYKTWINNKSILDLSKMQHSCVGNEVILTDKNSDGVVDLIKFEGFEFTPEEWADISTKTFREHKEGYGKQFANDIKYYKSGFGQEYWFKVANPNKTFQEFKKNFAYKIENEEKKWEERKGISWEEAKKNNKSKIIIHEDFFESMRQHWPFMDIIKK